MRLGNALSDDADPLLHPTASTKNNSRDSMSHLLTTEGRSLDSPPPQSNSLAISVIKRPDLLLWAAVFAIFSVPLVTLIDVPIARWFDRDPFSTDFADAIELTRGYAHGTGVFFILLSVLLLAPEKRWLIPRIAAMTCGGGAIATILKMFVLRPKPSQINLNFATLETAWLWRFDWTLNQVASFDAGTRAFPSGNMATAIALTIGLCMVAPKGRWLFVLFCGLTVLQRLHAGSHFLSDVVGGAAAGLIWSYICLHPKLVGSLFDKMEPENETARRRPKPAPFPEAEQPTGRNNLDQAEHVKRESARRAA
jgi:membrane-associated phospholipid phosphatase